MRSRGFHHVVRFVALSLFTLLIAVPAARAAAPTPSDNENRAAQIENLLGEVLGSNLATPQYADHGGGLHSLFVPLDSGQVERLKELLRKGDGVEGQAGPAYYFLAGGQSLTPPISPTAMIHAALSNTRLGYNYWVIVVNLGTEVTRNTTFKLTGPGRTFNRTAPLKYGANGIWTYWTAAPSVNTPGFYHFLPTVAGAGTFAIHTFAVNP